MTTPIDDRIDYAIQQWHDAVTEAERVVSDIERVMMCAPESPLHNALWALAGGWQQAIADLDDTCATEAWLEWWWHECRLGERPKEAALPGEDLQTIATIGDLIQLARRHRVAERARG